MARPTLNMAGVNQSWQTLYWDDQGRPVLEISSGQFIVHEPDGSVTIRHANNRIQLMCGQVYSPGPKAQPLVVCEMCRHPPYRFPFRDRPRHGLTSLKHSALCAGKRCGRRLCPRHTITISGRTYCPACSVWARAKQLATHILFKFEEE